MKGLVTILLFLSLIAQSQSIHVNGSGTPLSINGGGEPIAINPFFRANTVMDNGYYDGFPMISDVVNKTAWGIYKFSSTHAGGGPLMLIHTSNWGQNWTEDSITVDEDVIHSTNHSFIRTSTGRMIIAYKLTGDSVIRFAYNDNDDSAFTSIATVINPSTNISVTPCPNKMVETSYGTVLFVYYAYGTNGQPTSAKIMESSDNGLSFTTKVAIFTSSTQAPTAPYTDWRATETAICETHPTGNEATSKWIAIARVDLPLEGGTYYLFFKSSDGGNSWTIDETTDNGSFTDDNGQVITSSTFSRGLLYPFLASNSPVSARLIGDSVYIVNGERNATYGYALKYVTATPDAAFENKFSNWTRHPPVMYYYNGSNPGSSTDYGYPVLFKSGNDVFVSQYKVSNSSPLPGVTRRTLIETVKIK